MDFKIDWALAEMMLLEALPGQVGRFLDLDCGDGRLLALVRSHHPDANGVGVDISEPMLQRAMTRFADDPQISLYSHDLAAPLRDVAGVMAHAPFDVGQVSQAALRGGSARTTRSDSQRGPRPAPACHQRQ